MIDDLDQSGFYVTYKSAMLLFACGRWAEIYHLDNEVSFEMAFNDKALEKYFEALTVRMENDAADFVIIENTSGRDLHFTWQGSGSPKEYLPEAQGKYMQIERFYLDEEGQVKKDFRVGDLVTVSLRIKTDRAVQNTVIVDLLPGAFRIEDDALATRASQQKNVQNIRVNNSEELDDRLLIFADLKKSQSIIYSYQVRVVAEGEFQVPAASVESMYRPELSARSELSGKIKVTPMDSVD